MRQRRLPNVRARIGVTILVTVLVLFIAAIIVLARNWPFTRSVVEQRLGQELAGTVSIRAFRTRWLPDPGVDADNVQITSARGPISIQHMVIRASYAAFFHRSRDLKLVSVDGVVARLARNAQSNPSSDSGISIDHLVVNGSQLEFEPATAESNALPIGIVHADLYGIAAAHPIRFDAQLDWARPHGRLEVQGQYGPRPAAQPKTSPVSGRFHLQNADLAVFQNLQGAITADGKFTGQADQIKVDGTSNVSALKIGDLEHHPINIAAKFSATVNGTNADTHFDSMDTELLGTRIVWRGDIAEQPDPGKSVRLDMVSEQARVQDLLYVVTQAPQPSMLGPIRFQATVMLPPGNRPFLRKLRVDGDFNIGSARFGRFQSQSNVALLSEKARGEKKPVENPESIVADVKGHVSLRDGVATLSNVWFRVPGASATLNGTFNVISYVVDLHGRLALEKELSDTTTGFKSVLLKLVDPFFKRKNAGAVVPVSITGTYQRPVFSSLGMHAGG